MASHRFGDFFDRLASGGTAEIEDSESIGCRGCLKKTLLQGLPKRVFPPLAFAQIAQPVEKLTVVGREYHYLGVVIF